MKRLQTNGIGCRFGARFVGIVTYADDLFLLSGSRMGLQAMMSECERFGKQYNLIFSTNENIKKSKTKCMAFSKQKLPVMAPIILDGKPLPWVHELNLPLNHLGNALQSNNSMFTDCDNKRFNFIRKISSLNQEFHYCTADVKLKLYNIYAMSLYGSCLWDLFSEKCERLYKAWNVTVRMACNISRYSHRYLIEPVSNTLHPKVILCSRFVKFHNYLKENCSKPVVNVPSKICTNDLRTTYGSNLHKISKSCDVADLNPINVKRSMNKEQKWRLPIINNLLLVNNEKFIDRRMQHRRIHGSSIGLY